MRGEPFEPPEGRWALTPQLSAVAKIKVAQARGAGARETLLTSPNPAPIPHPDPNPNPGCTQVAIIEQLVTVANLRANFRVAKLLETFKALATDEAGAHELKRLGCYLDAGRLKDYDGKLLATLGADFEGLFVKGDGARMDLGTLAQRPLEPVLIDCLM